MKKFFQFLLLVLSLIPLVLLLLGYFSIHVNPIDSKLFPLLAYSLPYIILLNFISLPFLFFAKKWKLGILNLVILVLGNGYITRIYALGSKEEIQPGDLKIMSYNVRSFNLRNDFDLPQELIRDSIINYLSDAQVDIYCFQEFYHEKKKRRYVSIEKIRNVLSTKYLAHSSPDFTENNRYTGCYIFSKYPIIDQGLVNIQTNNPNRGKCQYADIQINKSRIIRVYNFHLASLRYNKDDYNFVENLGVKSDIDDNTKFTLMRVIRMFLDASRRRSTELDFVLEHARKSPYPTIICGDLNDTPTSNAYHRLSSQFIDAFQQAGRGFGKTYIGKMPSNRIDYIFHSDHFSTMNFTIQQEILSDHRAIQSVLRLNEKN